MAATESATVAEIVPYLNRLLDVAGMSPLPDDTTADNVLDRLKTLFSQIDPPKSTAQDRQTVDLAGIGEVELPPGVAMSNRLRAVSPQERQRQEIAHRIAKQRNIPYLTALQYVP